MNRNTEQHFATMPAVERPRSRFNRPSTHKTTANNGQLIPIYLDMDIMPGDTVTMDVASVIRMATPLYPVMDNLFADISFFYVPTRLLWNHFREFWGESKSAWVQPVEYQIPQIKTSEGHVFKEKSLADYFGLPLNKKGLSVSDLPFRAYVKIWNDWWRSEALQDEEPFPDTDATVYAADETGLSYLGGKVLRANKYFDYFSACLPEPQHGPSVKLPLGSDAPVETRGFDIPSYGMSPEPLRMMGESTATGFTEGSFYTGVYKYLGDDQFKPATKSSAVTGGTTVGLYPVNLFANLAQATAATVSEIRMAFQLQRFYEQLSLSGSRYIEICKSIFGVTSPDARLQRSEFLGSKRIPLNISQVLQTSATNETSPQGNTGAYSHTADSSHIFTKSFTEHGIIIGMMCIRHDRTYNQGIERGWSRKKFTDFYNPFFAHISNQAVLNKEIYAQGLPKDDEVFGYQEAWAEYRYKPSIVTGAMRTTYAQSLDAWHLADNYESLPILGPDWIQENQENVDRVLAVSSDIENQFICDFYFNPVYVRPMPIYSVPGLIDHV